MLGLLTAVHILIALVLVLVVLLQSARGTDLAGAFGGMGSQTAFGPRGTTTFLSKTTAVLAAAFMVSSLSLAIASNRSHGGTSGSVLSGEKPSANPQPAATPVPGAPGVGQPTVQVTPVPAPKPATPAGTPPAQSAPNVQVTPAPPSNSQQPAPPPTGQ